MHNNEIFIKTIGFNNDLINSMESIASLSKIKLKFFTFDSISDLMQKDRYLFRKAAINGKSISRASILIVNEMTLSPNFYLFNDRVVLCTSNPHLIPETDLSILYDIWTPPLTPLTVKFFFKKLLLRLKFEITDLGRNYKYQKQLLKMARLDYLTGLATRWYLHEYADKYSYEKNFTCIYCDLDNFKQVNDTYGHQIGDKVLSITAGIIKKEFKDGFPARLGGDEFVILMRGIFSVEEISDRIEKLFNTLFNYFIEQNEMKNLSMSAGISQSSNEEYKEIEKLIRESDLALYAAKNSGKNCYAFYNASYEQIKI